MHKVLLLGVVVVVGIIVVLAITLQTPKKGEETARDTLQFVYHPHSETTLQRIMGGEPAICTMRIQENETLVEYQVELEYPRARMLIQTWSGPVSDNMTIIEEFGEYIYVKYPREFGEGWHKVAEGDMYDIPPPDKLLSIETENKTIFKCRFVDDIPDSRFVPE